MKACALLLVSLAGAFLPLVAQAERQGTQVEPWNPNLGAFHWKIVSSRLPDGTVYFHVVLTVQPYYPEVSFNRGSSATLSKAAFDPKHGWTVTKNLRALPLIIKGDQAACDFSVTPAELADPNLCFAFSLWKKEKAERADFALLNDFFEFPASAVKRLADIKAPDRHVVAQKIAVACSVKPDKPEWKNYVPALLPYLDDPDRQIRYSTVEILAGIGNPVETVVPALIKTLDRYGRADSTDGLEAMTIHSLDHLEPTWRDRREVTEKIRRLPDFPELLD